VSQPIASGQTWNLPADQTVKVHLIIGEKNNPIFDNEIETENGANAFEIMKNNFDLKFTEYEFGVFIEEINGIKPSESEYWALYINDESASKGIADYTINEDMGINWKIQSFE